MSKVPLLGPRIAKMSHRTVPLPPKEADPAYQDQRHALWAAQVKRRAGYRCEKCGATDRRMFADHIEELRDGGARFDMRNGQCLCGSCHTVKTIIERSKRMHLRTPMS